MTIPLFSRHDIPLWSEPFAGAAAVALQVIGGRRCEPPVSWMGGKRRLAPVILQRLGLAPGCGARRVLLNDAGPWGWVWPAILDPETSAAVCSVLRGWADRDIRELWFELRDEGPRLDPAEAVAQWLVLQARSANGAPVFWSDARGDVDLLKGRHQSNGNHPRAGQAGALLQGSCEGRRPQPAGQRDPQQSDPRLMASDGRGVERPAGMKGERNGNKGGCGGLVRIETLAERVEALARATASWLVLQANAANGVPWDQTRSPKVNGRPCGGMVSVDRLAARVERLPRPRGVIEVRHGRAEDIPVPERYEPGSVWYLDPPYRGCTGYGWDVERVALLGMADRRARAGAIVAISEAVPLDAELGPGWVAHDLTRWGNGKPEWLTVYK